jgi:putative endopeptidase
MNGEVRVATHGCRWESANECSDRDTLLGWVLSKSQLVALISRSCLGALRMREAFNIRCDSLAPAVACALLVLAPLATPAQDTPKRDSHGIVVTNIDASVKPGDDFYQYANGDWIKRTQIPPDRRGVAFFTILGDLSDKRTVGLIEEAARANAPAGSSVRKIADLYNSYMDEAAIEAKGLAPLRPHLEAIAAIHNQRELARTLGESLRSDVDALNYTNFRTPNLFGLWVAPGFNDSEHYAAYLLQGGLQLPDREYYLGSSDRMRDIRTRYQAHISAMLKLAGFTDTDARAEHIVELEHAIAEKHLSLEENDDVYKANNTWTQADFVAKAPGLDWVEFFRGAGLSNQASFIVWQPTAFTGESSLVASASLDTWKDWLGFHLIDAYAGVLPKSLADEHFAFFGKILDGTPQQHPRWRRGVDLVNDLLGDVVGQIYAQRYFSSEAKAQAQAMVANLIAAFRRRIDALSWMDPATKTEAQAKLTTLYVGIGYPETWRDYSAYEVKAGDIFGNVWRASLFDYQRQVARLGLPVDRKEWPMPPQTVNSVNLPLQNALNFPAAILQPPFFDPQAAAAVYYGAIGSLIGHEISHTFDTEGSAFDSKGRLRNWWTPADLTHFNAAAAKLATQYDTYRPFPDLSVNGKQTLAENIADLAGIAAAYDGYRASRAGKTTTTQDGLSGDQQFFIAFGQSWGSKLREDVLRRQVMTDTHSPEQYRVDTVRNIDSWYSAFDVQPGEKLYLAPPDRVRIW